jgi:hypothetical protein
MSSDLERYYEVTELQIVGPYTLKLLFDDGTSQTIDFLPVLVGPVFKPLRDLAIFDQVQLNPETGTIEWPTGADFSPVVLHDWPVYRDKLIDAFTKAQAMPA